MDIRNKLYILEAVLAWAAAVWAIRKIRRANRVTAGTWSFVFLFAIAITAEINIVADGLNQFVGVNHFSWLVTYVSGAIGMYVIVRTLHVTLNIPYRPSLLDYGLIFTLISFFLLFPFVTQEPAIAEELLPYTLPLLLFRVVGYCYVGFACWVVFKTFNSLQRHDKVLHTRLRWLLLCLVAGMGISFFVIRIVYFTYVYIHPGLADSATVRTLAMITRVLAICCVGWVVFFIPAPILQTLTRPILHLDKLMALRELSVIQSEIATLSPPVVPPDTDRSWRERQRNLDFHLYRGIIAILDGKKTLTNLVEREAGLPEANNLKAQRLYHVLVTVDDNGDFHDLITHYRTIGRQWRKGVVE